MSKFNLSIIPNNFKGDSFFLSENSKEEAETDIKRHKEILLESNSHLKFDYLIEEVK